MTLGMILGDRVATEVEVFLGTELDCESAEEDFLLTDFSHILTTFCCIGERFNASNKKQALTLPQHYSQNSRKNTHNVTATYGGATLTLVVFWSVGCVPDNIVRTI